MNPDPADDSVFDEGTLARLSDRLGGAEVVRGLVEAYLPEAKGLAGEIKAGAASDDTVAVADAAHKLRSSSALLGLGRLARHCLDLERVARAGDTAETRRLAAETLTTYEASVRALGERAG